MRTCKRLANWVQIINAEGDVRLCSWSNNAVVGNCVNEDFSSLLNGEKARNLRKMISEGDYSNCSPDNCPYISNGKLEDVLIEVEEGSVYPDSLYLAYEGNCNYSCTCCTSFSHMQDTKQNDYREKYDLLEERIRAILPHVKHIGANGRGELFASPRIMKILSEWSPIAPVDECSVELETNGALFNESNWKRIENLGRYNLSVAITVMSFDEMVYKYLSGTALPIEKLLQNLKFVKTLREKGVINYLELATVMQELNFREMPEFTRRCLEEFGADKVRIRPIFPAGRLDPETTWFMDVRNPDHPYNALYKSIMSDGIFRDSRVLLWSNDLPSTYLRPSVVMHEIIKRIERIVGNGDFVNKTKETCGGKSVALFGLGLIGKTVAQVLCSALRIDRIYDRNYGENSFLSIPVFRIDNIRSFKGVIIITPYGRYEEMRTELVNNGFGGTIINLDNLLDL